MVRLKRTKALVNQVIVPKNLAKMAITRQGLIICSLLSSMALQSGLIPTRYLL